MNAFGAKAGAPSSRAAVASPACGLLEAKPKADEGASQAKASTKLPPPVSAARRAALAGASRFKGSALLFTIGFLRYAARPTRATLLLPVRSGHYVCRNEGVTCQHIPELLSYATVAVPTPSAPASDRPCASTESSCKPPSTKRASPFFVSQSTSAKVACLALTRRKDAATSSVALPVEPSRHLRIRPPATPCASRSRCAHADDPVYGTSLARRPRRLRRSRLGCGSQAPYQRSRPMGTQSQLANRHRHLG